MTSLRRRRPDPPTPTNRRNRNDIGRASRRLSSTNWSVLSAKHTTRTSSCAKSWLCALVLPSHGFRYDKNTWLAIDDHYYHYLRHRWQSVLFLFTNAEGSRGVGFPRRLSVCLSVCLFFCTISQNRCSYRISKPDIQMFNDESWNPFILGSKGQRPRSRVTTWVTALVRALASSSCLSGWLIKLWAEFHGPCVKCRKVSVGLRVRVSAPAASR